MVQNSKFTIQLLEKIGAPLARATQMVPLSGEDQDVQVAKIIAQLLGQAVQISISLNGALNVVEEEAQADSTRLALASLAAPLLADFYVQNERVPEDADITRLVKSLESVVAFADNFSAAEEGKSRLATIDHDAPLFDKTQSTLVVMQAMAPVMTAVSEFSFGQSEAKLMQDITAKLQTSAADIARNSGLGDKLSELMVLKALASLYAECHRTETQRLANSSGDEAREALSLDPVWEAFGLRTAMVGAILGMEMSVPMGAAQSGAPAPVAVPPPIAQPPEQSAPVSPVAPQEAPHAPPPSGGPMGFFKKPDAGAPAAAAPPSPPPVAPVEPVAAPVEPPPVTTQTDPAAAMTENAAPPSSPMGFFKPGAKKAEDDAAS